MTLFDPDKLDAAAAAELANVPPSQFVVGGRFDGHRVTGGLSYQRSWVNGWGLTAYAKAWWQDASVTPVGGSQSGSAVGVEAVKTFRRP